MGKSIRDQLISTGMATRHQALKAKKQSNKNAKKAQQEGKMTAAEQTAATIKQQKQQQHEKDKKLNVALEQKRLTKAIGFQVKQLIDSNKIPRIQGDEFIRFVDQKKVKKILVTTDILQKLEKGLLSVVKQQDNYEVIPTPIAKKIAQKQPEIVFDLSIKEKNVSSEEQNWYDDYPIPDDLIW